MNKYEEERRTLCVLHFRDQVNLGQIRDGAVHAAAASETRKLHDQWGRNDFMVSAAGFNLAEDIFISYLSNIAKGRSKHGGVEGLISTPARTLKSSLVR
jgi:hypothetical protein